MKRICCLLAAVLLLTFSACADERAAVTPSPSAQLTLSPEPSAPEQTEPPPSEEPTPSEVESSVPTESSEVEVASSKTLIAYFSLADIVPEGADASTHATPASGNTESAALEIQRQAGGDLFAIKTVREYPISHQECSSIAEEEMCADARPELSTHVENMDDYDTVYIGYPIWWYIEPMAIRTFLEEYDFSGKTIVPFCTTLGTGVAESQENIQNLCPSATVLDGLTLHTGREDFSESVAQWLAQMEISQ